MNEEFDKYVRNLLQDAEEEVSPRVWEGVAAGLNRKARVVPVWRWAAVSVAAAAAVVAAFVVFHSNPSISYQETPSATAMAEPAAPAVAEEPASVTLEEPVSVPTKAVAAKRSHSRQEVVAAVSALPAEEIQPSAVQPQQPVRLVQKNAVPVTERTALLDDHSLLNQLAYTERQKPSDKGFSLIASGQIQGNQRGEVPSMAYSKPYSAPPLDAGDGIFNETPETNFRLPFSIGLAVRYNFTNRWAVGTGVRYTNLGRTFIADARSEGVPIPQTDVDNEQHWLGVPLNVYYDIVNRGRWRVHAFVGGTTEFLLENDFLVHYSSKDIHFHKKDSPSPQWSVAGGLGVEFRITPHVGIYLDPNFRYYFNTENQPRSLRTIQPLRFEMEAGVRFSFGQK